MKHEQYIYFKIALLSVVLAIIWLGSSDFKVHLTAIFCLYTILEYFLYLALDYIYEAKNKSTRKKNK